MTTGNRSLLISSVMKHLINETWDSIQRLPSYRSSLQQFPPKQMRSKYSAFFLLPEFIHTSIYHPNIYHGGLIQIIEGFIGKVCERGYIWEFYGYLRCTWRSFKCSFVQDKCCVHASSSNLVWNLRDRPNVPFKQWCER